MRYNLYLQVIAVMLALFGAANVGLARPAASKKTASAKVRTKSTVAGATSRKNGKKVLAVVTSRKSGRHGSLRTRTQAAVIHSKETTLTRASLSRRHRKGRLIPSPWTEPTYADSTVGDNIDGENLVVRKAAVDALGPYNGTIVVADPQTGRLLTIVNQKLALKGAFQPCSTVKVMVSLASLSEGLVDSSTPLHLTHRFSMDMTQALAKSNNAYFAHLGEQLGFERVQHYGKLFGFGEKAGLDIPGEEPGYLAAETPDSGIGMMTSFGDGIRLTALELTSIVTTVANGGTMYYLQYPKNQDEAQKFVPRIKRSLEIGAQVSQIKPGMLGAVEYGTARRANFDGNEAIFGKTGTCTDTAQPGVHLGWFGSFTDSGKNKLVVVVLLTGGRGISGPIASGIAGNVYHNLAAQRYISLNQVSVPESPAILQTCCRQ